MKKQDETLVDFIIKKRMSQSETLYSENIKLTEQRTKKHTTGQN